MRSRSLRATKEGPSLTVPAPLPPGFSTLAQLKRRNTLKDGIIMIQTLLIILFIIVPIFLLLDKVTGTGGPGSSRRAGQTCAGSPFPQSLPADSPRQLLLRASALLAECTSPLTSQLLPLTSYLSPLTRGQSPGASAAWPSGGGGGDTNALLSILTRQDDSKPGMEEDHTYEVRSRVDPAAQRAWGGARRPCGCGWGGAKV